MYIRTYFVCSTFRVFNKGLLTQNATWCQNRGCICISSVRRTYGRIHIPATIILWSELFPKKRREKRSKERFFNLSSSTEYSGVSTFLQDFFEYSVFYSVSTCNPATPSNSTYRINSSPRTTRLIPCHPVQISTRHLPATAPRASKHSTRQNPAIRPLQHKQASSNSTRQKQHSTWQPASTQSLQ